MLAAKLIGSLCLLAAIGGMGWQRGRQFSRRISLLETSVAFLFALRQELSLTLAPPRTLVEGLLSRPDLAALPLRLPPEGEFADGWQQAVERLPSPFTTKDKARLSMVGLWLGRTDLDTQLGQLDQLTAGLRQEIAVLRAAEPTETKLPLQLGVLLGLGAVVLLW